MTPLEELHDEAVYLSARATALLAEPGDEADAIEARELLARLKELRPLIEARGSK